MIFTVIKKKHDQTGADIWVARLETKLTPTEFGELKRTFKDDHGAYYSHFIKGFVFSFDPTDLPVIKGEQNIKPSVDDISGHPFKLAKRLDLPKLEKSNKKPRKDVIINEIKAGKMEYAPFRVWNGMRESDDYLTVTDDSFKPAKNEKQIITELQRAIRQSHWTYSVQIKHDDELGYYISFKSWYIRAGVTFSSSAIFLTVSPASNSPRTRFRRILRLYSWMPRRLSSRIPMRPPRS